VIDMIKARKFGVPVVGVNFTAGLTVTETPGGFSVPKKDLVSVLQLHLQSARIKIAASLPFADILGEEIKNFRDKPAPKDLREVYGTWREGAHDDMVCALVIALWYGVRSSPGGRRPMFQRTAEPWDPLRYGHQAGRELT